MHRKEPGEMELAREVSADAHLWLRGESPWVDCKGCDPEEMGMLVRAGPQSLTQVFRPVSPTSYVSLHACSSPKCSRNMQRSQSKAN